MAQTVIAAEPAQAQLQAQPQPEAEPAQPPANPVASQAEETIIMFDDYPEGDDLIF